MYISRYNSVQMKFDLHTFKGKVEEVTLINSGTTANFIKLSNGGPDYGSGHKKLKNPLDSPEH